MIVITGILFAALLAGLAGMIKTSALHRRQADVGTVVRTAAEAVKNAPYELCPSASYSAALTSATPPSGSPVNVPTLVDVTNIDGSSRAGGDNGLQRVQVAARSRDGKTSESLWIVKRKP